MKEFVASMGTVPVNVMRPSDILENNSSSSGVENKYNVQLTTRDDLNNAGSYISEYITEHASLLKHACSICKIGG